LGIWQRSHYLDIAEIDQELLCEYFSEEVFGMFLESELLSEEDVLLMKSWKHSGFSVWFGDDISAESEEQRLFTGRYLVKCPLSLDRLSITDDESVMYVGKERDDGSDPDSMTFSPLEFLAELSQHIPNTYEQLIRYYGYYSARSRGARRREAELQKLQNQPDHEAVLPDPDSDKKPVSKS
jgi:hypothetical protein